MADSNLGSETNFGTERNASVVPRIAMLSIGETPRTDVLNVLFGNLQFDVRIDEIGLLDGLTEEDIKQLAPTANDVRLSAFRHGRLPAALGTKESTAALARIALEVDQAGYDLIIMMSSGIYLPSHLRTPVLETQKLVDTWTECHVQAGHQVGLIYLVESQHDTVENHYRSVMRNLQTVELASTNSQLKPVVNSIGGCDIIVLNSISYTGDLARRIARISRKPVVTASQILAGNLKIEVERLGGQRSRDLTTELKNVCPELSSRELRVLTLACAGLKNREIGDRLKRSVRTIEVHRANGLRKAKVRSVVELMRLLEAHRP